MAHTEGPLTLADSVNGIPLRIAKALDGTTDVDFVITADGVLYFDELSKSWSPARWIDVRKFGALGDGTNQTTELQTAIDSLALSGGLEGAILYFPQGLYVVDGLVVDADNGSTFIRSIAFKGAGMRASIIQLADGADADVIQCNSTDQVGYQTYCTFSHLQIDGNASNNASGYGLAFYYSFDNTVKHCLLTNCVDGGLYHSTESTNLWVRDTVIRSNAGKGAYIIDPQTVVFRNCDIANNGGIGIHVAGTPSAGRRQEYGNIALSGLYMNDNTTAEIYFEDYIGASVTESQLTGAVSGAYDHPIFVLDNADHITLRDLVFVSALAINTQDWISVVGQPPSNLKTEGIYTAITAHETWQVGIAARGTETIRAGLQPGLPHAIHNPYLGVMKDGQENVLTDSKDLSGADSWSTTNTTLTTSSQTNPFGDSETVSEIQFTGGASGSWANKTIDASPTTGDIYTVIAVVKAASGSEGKVLRLEFQQSGSESSSRVQAVLDSEWQTYICKVQAENTNSIILYIFSHQNDNGGSSTFTCYVHDIAVVKSDSTPCLLPTDNTQTPDVGGLRVGTNLISETLVLRPQAEPTPVAEGMVIYDNTANKLKVYTGAGWETITSS